MNDSLKIIIWGTKRGRAVLCSSFEEKEYRSEEIEKTWQDIRGYIRVERSGLYFWAVEFTTQYKVFSIYISASEPGSSRVGAYVAINIYIPHSKRCRNPFALLKALRDRYVERYIDKDTKQMLPKAEQIRDFEDLIAREVLTDTQRRFGRLSKGTGIPAYFYYDNESEVEEFFKQPYRPKLYEHQEVIFISKVYKDKGYFNLKNAEDIITPEDLQKIEDGYILNITSNMKSLKVNEELCDIKGKNTYEKVYDEDTLEIIFERRYFEDFLYRTSVEKLRGGGRLSHNMPINIPPPVDWVPRKVAFSISNTLVMPAKFMLKSGLKEFISSNGEICVNEEFADKMMDLYALNAQGDKFLLESRITYMERKIELKKLAKLKIGLGQDVNEVKIRFRGESYQIVAGGKILYCLDYNAKQDNISLDTNKYKVVQSGTVFYIECKEKLATATPILQKREPINRKRKVERKTNHKKESSGGNIQKGLLLLFVGLILGGILGFFIYKWTVPNTESKREDIEGKISVSDSIVIAEKNKEVEALNDSILSLNKTINSLKEEPVRNLENNSHKSGSSNIKESQKSTSKYAKEIALKNKNTDEDLAKMYWKETDGLKKIKIKRALARRLSQIPDTQSRIGKNDMDNVNSYLEAEKSKYTEQ